MHRSRALTALVLALAAAPAWAGPVDSLGGFARRECQAFAEAFYRIAAMRDAGANRARAADEGASFLTRLGQTGSQLKHNYRPAAERFTEYVFARPRLDPAILFVHGLYHCALSRTTGSDAALEAGLARLDRVTRDCQARHRGRDQRQALGGCIERGMDAAPAAGTPPAPER